MLLWEIIVNKPPLHKMNSHMLNEISKPEISALVKDCTHETEEARLSFQAIIERLLKLVGPVQK